MFIFLNMEWFIKLHRKILEWEWYSDANTFRLFIHILLNANFKDKKWKWILIKRWQFITSRKKLSIDLWLTEQQIRTCISKLISTSEITNETTNTFTLISLMNYDLYQWEITNQITNEQPTDNQRITTTKEWKERKENISPEIIKKKYDEKYWNDNPIIKSFMFSLLDENRLNLNEDEINHCVIYIQKKLFERGYNQESAKKELNSLLEWIINTKKGKERKFIKTQNITLFIEKCLSSNK